jgi:hypothetical protein
MAYLELEPLYARNMHTHSCLIIVQAELFILMGKELEKTAATAASLPGMKQEATCSHFFLKV